MMKLYGKAPTRVVRGMWMINELGLDCELVPVSLLSGDHNDPEFRALNPAGRVPVLVDGEVVVCESMAIALYLAEKFPEKGFLPQKLAQRAEMYRWLFFMATEIEAPLERIARNTLLYPEEKRQPSDIAVARGECRAMLRILDSHMEAREFLLGDSVCVADFMAAYTLDWANEEGLLDQAPHLLDYLQRMYSRPAAPPTIALAMQALGRD